MSISNIGMIVWFGFYGVNAFWGAPLVNIVLGITALVICVALILRK